MPGEAMQHPSELVPEDSDRIRFNEALGSAIHAVAQPLTVLRSAIEAARWPGLSPVDKRRYLDISAEQVERACALFQSLQQLLLASENEPDCAAVELSYLLAPVIEEQKRVLLQSGVEFRAVIPEGLGTVVVDFDRTLQALCVVLRIAASVSSTQDLIELMIQPRHGYAELIVRNRRSHSRRLNSLERLNLAVAEANMRSQRGGFGFTEDPFRATLILPFQDGDAFRNEEASLSSYAHIPQ